MLKSLTLRAGTRNNPQPFKVDISGILCVVGPNNSGKSYLLRQLEHALRVMTDYKPEFIIDFNIESNLDYYKEILEPSAETAISTRVSDTQSSPDPVFTYNALELPEFGKNMAVNIDRSGLRDALSQYNGGESYYKLKLSGFFTFLTSRLDGRRRFELMSPSPSLDYRASPKTILQVLFSPHSPDAAANLRAFATIRG